MTPNFLLFFVHIIHMHRAAIACMILIQIAYAQNLYSTLILSALNADGAPLEGAEFFLECPNTPDFNAYEGKMFVCRTNETGTCNPGKCWGCESGSTASVYSRYLGSEQRMEIENWNGRECVVGYGGIEGCCLPISSQKTPPENDVPVFRFSTADVGFLVFEGNNPASNATVLLSVPGTAYASACNTDRLGACRFEKIPEGTQVSYSVALGDSRIEGVVAAGKDVTVQIVFKSMPSANQTVGNASEEPLEKNFSVSLRTSFEILEKREGVPYLIHFLEANLTLFEGQEAAFEERSYNMTVLAFGKPAYFSYMKPAPGKTAINLSTLQCMGACNVCGCEGDALCTFSPFAGNYGCCRMGMSWNGAKCSGQSSMRIFFVFINTKKDGGMFYPALQYVKFMENELGLGYSSYYFVQDILYAGPEACSGEYFSLDLIEGHFLEWYKKRGIYDQNLAPWEERYRVVGIDFNNTCNASSYRAYTKLPNLVNGISPVYVIQLPNRIQSHLVLHEIGHTFGLCDDYNPKVWDSQNLPWSSCPNAKPTARNSDCKEETCPQTGFCCYGIWHEDGTCSVMGSADDFRKVNNVTVPIFRRLGDDSRNHMLKKIEWVDAR